MTSIAALLAWLLQFPVWFQLTEHARNLLGEILRVLIRPGALSPTDLRCLERSVQIAEACAERAIWLRAMAMAAPGARPIRRPAPFRYIPSRTPPTPDRLLWRVLQLHRRIDALDDSARRALQAIGRTAPCALTIAAAPRPPRTPTLAFSKHASARPASSPVPATIRTSGHSQTGPPAPLHI